MKSELTVGRNLKMKITYWKYCQGCYTVFNSKKCPFFGWRVPQEIIHFSKDSSFFLDLCPNFLIVLFSAIMSKNLFNNNSDLEFCKPYYEQ